jgi:hypothetical protein
VQGLVVNGLVQVLKTNHMQRSAAHQHQHRTTCPLMISSSFLLRF